MWERRSTYGDRVCSLCDSVITSIEVEDGVFSLGFAEGFVLLPGTWANPFKTKAYRSEKAMIAIQLNEEIDEQGAVEVLIRGVMYSFGKPTGLYEKYISLAELMTNIGEYHDEYEIMDVYSSERDGKMLLRGTVRPEWRNASRFRQEIDSGFEIVIYQKKGAKMRYFWNELDLKKPIEE